MQKKVCRSPCDPVFPLDTEKQNRTDRDNTCTAESDLKLFSMKAAVVQYDPRLFETGPMSCTWDCPVKNYPAENVPSAHILKNPLVQFFSLQ